jgi:hypothetical protein
VAPEPRSSMSALGQKRTYAAQHAMSALPPTATAKADSRSCPHCPRERTCAVQLGMSALASTVCLIDEVESLAGVVVDHSALEFLGLVGGNGKDHFQSADRLNCACGQFASFVNSNVRNVERFVIAVRAPDVCQPAHCRNRIDHPAAATSLGDGANIFNRSCGEREINRNYVVG